MIEHERLSFEAGQVDYEYTLFQALVNEGKHIKVLNSKRQQFSYNEKQLRDAAAAEVMSKLSATGQNQDMDDDDGKGSTRKRKHLNPDEKQKQSRDRNREHAKNTRLRKKAYVTKLKELVDQMTRQKEIEERERRILGEKIHDTQVIRRNAVRLFLAYRSACILDPMKWSKILDENITFSLPITPYRSFSRAEISNNSRVINGIDGVIADCCSLALMTEIIGINSEEWKAAIIRGEGCTLNFGRDSSSSSQDNMLAAGELIMCHYILKTEHSNSLSFDNNESLIQYGMLQCRFNRKHKIISAEMMYDVMGFMQQIQKASGISPESSIVPNTLDMALQSCKEARAILINNATKDFLHVNEEWTNSTGLSQSEVEGTPFLRVFEPQKAFVGQIDDLIEDCAKGRPGSRVILYQINLEANVGSKIDPLGSDDSISAKSYSLAYVRMIPLTTDNEASPTHILAIILPLDIPESKEELEKLIGTHSTIIGTTATSSNNRKREQNQFLETYENEFIRQTLTFQSHYTVASQPTNVSMVVSSNDLQNIGLNMSNSAIPIGFPTAFNAVAPMQKSFMYHNFGNVTGGLAGNMIGNNNTGNNTGNTPNFSMPISESQFSPYYSNIPTNLQSIPAVHHPTYRISSSDPATDAMRLQMSLGYGPNPTLSSIASVKGTNALSNLNSLPQYKDNHRSIDIRSQRPPDIPLTVDQFSSVPSFTTPMSMGTSNTGHGTSRSYLYDPGHSTSSLPSSLSSSQALPRQPNSTEVSVNEVSGNSWYGSGREASTLLNLRRTIPSYSGQAKSKMDLDNSYRDTGSKTLQSQDRSYPNASI